MADTNHIIPTDFAGDTDGRARIFVASANRVSEQCIWTPASRAARRDHWLRKELSNSGTEEVRCA